MINYKAHLTKLSSREDFVKEWMIKDHEEPKSYPCVAIYVEVNPASSPSYVAAIEYVYPDGFAS